MSWPGLADGYLSTQLLYVAAELRVADVLADRPASAGEIAGRDRSRARPAAPGCCVVWPPDDVLEELADGRFAVTPVGQMLVDGAAGSLRGAVLARGRLYYRAVGELLGGARSGTTAFELVHGKPFFDHLAARPAESAAFRESMAVRSAREAGAVVAAYDFTRFRRLIDVGGGPGVLLRAILDDAPALPCCEPAGAPCPCVRRCCSSKPDSNEQRRTRPAPGCRYWKRTGTTTSTVPAADWWSATHPVDDPLPPSAV